MKTKIEIKSIFGDLIFEFKKENNTIKNTLLEAIKNGVDLYSNSGNVVGKIEDWMNHDNIGSRKSRTLFFKIDKGVFVQCGSPPTPERILSINR